jgi:hypothetical protein
VVGAIFPILAKHLLNLFSCKQDIFAKFTKLRIDKGSIIVFYVPHEKLLVGEARVKHTEKLNPYTAWSLYKERLFLCREEYDRYVMISPVSHERRRMSDIVIFELTNITKYNTVVCSKFPVTSSGRYLTKEMIDHIRKQVDQGRAP